jgi:hypothetical protein
MDQQRLRADLEARRKPGLVVKRLGGLKGMASSLAGRDGVPRQIRALVEEAFAADVYTRSSLVGLRRGKIGALFQEHSENDWKRAVETLLPHLAASAESACKIVALRPYQDGVTRKPFRCPRSPQMLADIRGRWLLDTTLLVGEYEVDIRWVAERAAALAGWSGAVDLGWLLAGAMDAGDETANEVFEILKASAQGEHEIGQMGRHVTQALMSCSRPDAWEFVEKLLLSAQRQEGLRQSILESVDESHPEAFRRTLRLIREENLARFSSVVRAADTWFGFEWDGASALKIDTVLERALLFLENAAARTAALDESDAETVYLALWSIAFGDIDSAVPAATALLSSSSPEIRFVATHFLVQSYWTSALPPLVDMLADENLQVASRALDAFWTDVTAVVDGKQLFQRLEELIARTPKRSTAVHPLVWPWWKRKLEKQRIAAAMAANASAVPGERMLPYVPDLDPSQREAYVRQTAALAPRWGGQKEPKKARTLSETERTMVVELLGDASAEARRAAFEAMREQPLREDEVDRLIDLLARKPGDLRNGCIARLRTLPDAALLATADRLLADPSDLRRLGGLELLRDAAEAKRMVSEVRTRVERYAADHPTPTAEERAHVSAVIGDEQEIATTEDALGLLDSSSLRTWPAAVARRVELDTPGARASLTALSELVLAHQATEIRTPSGETKLLVESAGWWSGPRRIEQGDAPEVVVPLADLWRGWLQQRPDSLRDADGLELLRTLVTDADAASWKTSATQKLVGLGQYSAGSHFLRGLLEWCVAWDPPTRATDFLLDGLEGTIAELTERDYREIAADARKTVFSVLELFGAKQPAHRVKLARAEGWLRRFRWWRGLFPGSVEPAHAERLYGLLRGFEARAGTVGVFRITLEDFLGAYRAGAVEASELIDLLVGPRNTKLRSGLLREVSARKPPRALSDHPELLALVDRCRRRVVEVETGRGDRTTAASPLAVSLRWTGGLDTLSRALAALGKSHFARHFGWSGTEASRQETLSHLIVRSVPREEDTPAAFARWAREARIRETRLVELALYAPQWAAHVNDVLDWSGLEDAVWWIQAHTKDDRSWRLDEVKEIWAAEVSERTPLAAADLMEGAVDVAWFRRAHADLGPERWKSLDAAAKYAASSAGHTRAQLFARAMGGLVTRDEILERIDKSRHQDSVRALGLLPLAEAKQRRDDLLQRYTRLQRFRREARKFGSQRQQSEGRAVAIGLANLARTAGFRDPQRLQWTMEQEAVADLARGPVVLVRGEVSLELSVDAGGVPALKTTKGGKALKALPAALKKDPEVVELKDRLQELRRQRSRTRDALEDAMCRGDQFKAPELRALLDHPILAPALSRLVFVGDEVAGYLAEGGRLLRDHSGAQQVLGSDEEVRIAHPHDLFVRGDWSAWQHECFRAERVQPFKQLFRELYPMTDMERGTHQSRRYAGHQVNPRQALALLGARGWVAHPEQGVSRTFHEDGLTVRLGFQEAFYTPAEIEGLTLEQVVCTKKGEWMELPLDKIPARLFSEAMRDLDLVVSVAHRGGVDPEATASTIEMRASLVKETCELLGLGNIELKPNHVLVRGKLGTYSVHLGSAGVTLMPGTALPIVAVHSQHRGRLFLPFADDDPRTAEVLSKVLLLARDNEIRDANILAWIRAAQGGGRG